ncbi:MAG: hypothetical protein FWE39_00530 [Nocardiaceae bacterium]|nr:hypothetical protein [Nocardiaceae bacterium]
MATIVVTMRGTYVGVGAALAVLAAAGMVYLHERPPERPASAQIVPHVTCLDPGMFPGRFPSPVSQTYSFPEPGTVPDGFDPVAVVVCTPVSSKTYFESDGQTPAGTSEVVNEERREGDFDGLLAALSERSDPQGWWIEAWAGRTHQPATHCAPGTACPLLWLVDHDGRAIRPWIPLDRSGRPKVAAHYAIAQLPFVGQIPHHLDVPAETF